MQTAQERILNLIEAKVIKQGMSVALKKDFSNVGQLLIYRSDVDPVAIASVHYDFQSDTYTLSIFFKGVGVPSQVGRAGYFAHRQGYTQDTRFWDVLQETLVKARTTLALRK